MNRGTDCSNIFICQTLNRVIVPPLPSFNFTILKLSFNLDENISVAFAYHTFQLLILQIGFHRKEQMDD